MDKIARLRKEIEFLNEEKKKAEKNIEKLNEQIELNYKRMIYAYQEFYSNKTDKDFILYKKYPSMEALKLFTSNIRFPLYEFGELNAKEVAEIIKNIYQFRTNQEFKILTLGVTEIESDAIYGEQALYTKPHLYFMIGNDKTLKDFKEFDGQFVSSDKLYTHILFDGHGKNLINIELDKDYDNSMGISCLTGNIFDKKDFINYITYDNNNRSFGVSQSKQIFANNIRPKLFRSKVTGIKDVLDFKIHPFDSEIAKILISIIIYKRNNQIEELTADDYNHIFDVLYGEKVDIVDAAKKDIPNKLIYVPNK